MADPASVLSLIAASLTITIRAATIGKDIHSLTSKFRSTNFRVKQLSIHVSAIRVAARSLSSWLEDDTVGSEEVEDVKEQLLDVLSACCGLLSDLQDHVAKALAGAESVGFKGAVSYIWDEDIIKETTDTLHHQETALILMLQALTSLDRKERRNKFQEHVVVQTLEKAKKPSSSIFGLFDDGRSRLTQASETSERLDMMFTFDNEIAGSAVYRNAFTALLRSNMARKEIAAPVESEKDGLTRKKGPKFIDDTRAHDTSRANDQGQKDDSPNKSPSKRDLRYMTATNRALREERRIQALKQGLPPPRLERLRRYEGVMIPTSLWEEFMAEQTSVEGGTTADEELNSASQA